MTVCQHCGVDDVHSFEARIRDILSFEHWSEEVAVNTTRGSVKLVERSTGASPYFDAFDSGYPQGHEGKAHMIFEVDGRYFRKEGTQDSYGENYWNGKFSEVRAAKKTITAFEEL